MTDESFQTPSIQARIAALNLGHVGRAPTRTSTAVGSNEYPSERPTLEQRSYSINAASQVGISSIAKHQIGNEPVGSRRNGILPPPTITRNGHVGSKPRPPPRLPPRTPSQPSPSLPPRRHLNRQDSTESIASTISNISGLSNGTARTSASRKPSMDGERMMAPVFDPTNLLPLPPKRPIQGAEKQRIGVKGRRSTPSGTPVEISPLPNLPSLPPRPSARNDSLGAVRRLPLEQPPASIRSASSFSRNQPNGNFTTNMWDKTVPNPSSTFIPVIGVSPSASIPPQVPLTSRPNLSKPQASNQKLQSTGLASCLLCRDFSGPDSHAAKYPRESIPSLDWLATQLVAPFSSLTDKARAIFTWLHHNISYDVVAFFNNKVQPSTPASTISTGLAVCEGYAGLFTAIATKAGLESVVVGGHGKGYGFCNIPPGGPVPAEYSTHAWNAVRIDNGEWKLIDCCWGAGGVNGKGQPYNKTFTPRHFTMSNNEFGNTHFPTNKSQFFRTDGRHVSWEEYIIGDRGGDHVRVYSGDADAEGLSETTFLPKYLKIPVAPSKHSGPTVRFQFEKRCEHWDPVKHGPGKPYVFILGVHGVDGREEDNIPFETNGSFWWIDVTPQNLGAPGQTVSIYTIATIGDGTGRGLSVEEYRLSKGRKGWSGVAIAAWELI